MVLLLFTCFFAITVFTCKKAKSLTVLIAIVTISLCTFTFTGQDQTPPAQITNFLQGNLLNRDEVKGGKEYNEENNDGFKLPCEATGKNLKWTWQHNGTDIFTGCEYKYKVQGDGSLIGESLLPDQSGNYQCFVKDSVTMKNTFSRKVQVKVTCKSLHFTLLLCSSRKYPYCPHRNDWNFLEGWGVL